MERLVEPYVNKNKQLLIKRDYHNEHNWICSRTNLI